MEQWKGCGVLVGQVAGAQFFGALCSGFLGLGSHVGFRVQGLGFGVPVYFGSALVLSMWELQEVGPYSLP